MTGNLAVHDTGRPPLGGDQIHRADNPHEPPTFKHRQVMNVVFRHQLTSFLLRSLRVRNNRRGRHDPVDGLVTHALLFGAADAAVRVGDRGEALCRDFLAAGSAGGVLAGIETSQSHTDLAELTGGGITDCGKHLVVISLDRLVGEICG